MIAGRQPWTRPWVADLMDPCLGRGFLSVGQARTSLERKSRVSQNVSRNCFEYKRGFTTF